MRIVAHKSPNLIVKRVSFMDHAQYLFGFGPLFQKDMFADICIYISYVYIYMSIYTYMHNNIYVW